MDKKSDLIRKYKNVPTSVILFIFILFATIRLIYIFSLRDGHHVDEVWSYGFANSYYIPHLYGGFSESEWTNIGEWITGDTFNDYITVSEGQRFSFDSILYNKKYDLSPPLYDFLLHIICSMFPGKFSWWYAFIISLFAYIPTLLFVYLLSYEFTESRFCGFFTMLYYVFSGCGTANFIYLRIYHLMTLFSLALAWLIVRIVKEKADKKGIYFCVLPVVTVLGALTHYYFLVIAFFLTGFSALLLLIKKRFKHLFELCIVMLLSVCIFFLIWPQMIKKLFYRSASSNVVTGISSLTDYYSFPYSWDLATANRRFFVGTIGLYINFTYANIIMFVGTMVFIAIICLLIVFLFRNEKWMKKFLYLLKNMLKKAFLIIQELLKRIDYTIIAVILTVLGYILFIPLSAPLTDMGYVERYFFSTMALFIIVLFSVLGLVIQKLLTHKNIVLCLLACILTLILLFFSCRRSYIFNRDFEFLNSGDREIKELVSGEDCYVCNIYLRDLIWMSPLLNESNNVYMDYLSLWNKDDYVLPALKPDCLLVINTSMFISSEQKEELDSTGSVSFSGLSAPEAFMTEEEFIDTIEAASGYNYVMISANNTFDGIIHIYKSVQNAQ